MENLTEKQINVLETLKEKCGGSAFAEEVQAEMEDVSVQSVRVTLSSLEKRGICSKEKALYEGKEKTKYTVV